MTPDWADLAEWWLGEVIEDPSYEDYVLPLVDRLVHDEGRILEVGCGQGQVLRRLRRQGRTLVGLDVNPVLASAAAKTAPVVLARLPDIDCLRSHAFDTAVVVLVLEHLAEVYGTLAALRRVVKENGSLVAVLNHPVLTPPGAAAVVDPADGEVFWRWGTYLQEGATEERAGAGTIRFYHRPLGALLTAAAHAGWDLEKAEEVEWASDGGAGPPRLLGLRWRAQG